MLQSKVGELRWLELTDNPFSSRSNPVKVCSLPYSQYQTNPTPFWYPETLTKTEVSFSAGQLHGSCSQKHAAVAVNSSPLVGIYVPTCSDSYIKGFCGKCEIYVQEISKGFHTNRKLRIKMIKGMHTNLSSRSSEYLCVVCVCADEII